MKPAYYAAKASAHRVHAGYAKAEADKTRWSLATWIVITAMFAVSAVLDPNLGRFAWVAIGVIAIALTLHVRCDAQDRYERHVLDADKYALLADQGRRYKENR